MNGLRGGIRFLMPDTVFIHTGKNDTAKLVSHLMEHGVIKMLKVGDKVQTVNIPNPTTFQGTYAGPATDDKLIGIIILDDPLPDHLAITVPMSCMERI